MVTITCDAFRVNTVPVLKLSQKQNGHWLTVYSTVVAMNLVFKSQHETRKLPGVEFESVFLDTDADRLGLD